MKDKNLENLLYNASTTLKKWDVMIVFVLILVFLAFFILGN